jgi:hypothetical protein
MGIFNRRGKQEEIYLFEIQLQANTMFLEILERQLKRMLNTEFSGTWEDESPTYESQIWRSKRLEATKIIEEFLKSLYFSKFELPTGEQTFVGNPFALTSFTKNVALNNGGTLFPTTSAVSVRCMELNAMVRDGRFQMMHTGNLVETAEYRATLAASYLREFIGWQREDFPISVKWHADETILVLMIRCLTDFVDEYASSETITFFSIACVGSVIAWGNSFQRVALGE